MTEEHSNWTFLSNYAHVLLCIAENPESRLRDISTRVGITERSVQRIINHLKEAGILVAVREGRRNHYLINVDHQLRHPIESHRSIAALLAALTGAAKVDFIRRQYVENNASKAAN